MCRCAFVLDWPLLVYCDLLVVWDLKHAGCVVFSLQAVFAKQKQSYIDQLTKADAARQQLQASVQQLEEQLVRATTEMQQRRQQAADTGENADRQLSLLRKVGGLMGWFLVLLHRISKPVPTPCGRTDGWPACQRSGMGSGSQLLS